MIGANCGSPLTRLRDKAAKTKTCQAWLLTMVRTIWKWPVVRGKLDARVELPGGGQQEMKVSMVRTNTFLCFLDLSIHSVINSCACDSVVLQWGHEATED